MEQNYLCPGYPDEAKGWDNSRMQGDRPQQGYQLLAMLRKLETKLARLDKRWTKFRADPRPERLAEVQRTFEGVGRALASLAAQLGSTGSTSAGTNARAVVEAGRTLDATLAEVTRAWGFLRGEPDPGGLDGLADRLARAEAAAAILGLALPTPGDPERPSDPPTTAPGEEETGNLDALLRRVHDDWQTLRRQPAPDRVGVLRDELAEARRRAEGLRLGRASTHLPGPS